MATRRPDPFTTGRTAIWMLRKPWNSRREGRDCPLNACAAANAAGKNTRCSFSRRLLLRRRARRGKTACPRSAAYFTDEVTHSFSKEAGDRYMQRLPGPGESRIPSGSASIPSPASNADFNARAIRVPVGNLAPRSQPASGHKAGRTHYLPRCAR